MIIHHDNLPQLSEDLPDMPLYILAESSSACDYCVDEEEAAVAKGVRGVMQVIIVIIIIIYKFIKFMIMIMITASYNVLITLTIRMSDPRCLFFRLTVANRDSKTSLVFRWLIQILMICIAIMIILMVIIISLICPWLLFNFNLNDENLKFVLALVLKTKYLGWR